MSDNRTTELREKLTERGVEFATDDFDHLLTTYWQANNVFVQYLESIGDYVDEDDPTMKLRMNNVTPEQAIAATLSRPKVKKVCGELADMEFGDMCDECYWNEGEGNDD